VDNFPDIYTLLSQTYGVADDPTVSAEIKSVYDHYLMSAATAQRGDQARVPAGSLWAEHYRRSPIYESYVANRQSGEVARPMPASIKPAASGLTDTLRQFGVLARRYLDLIRHDKFSLGVLLAVMPLIGLFLLLISNGAALVGNLPEEILDILATTGRYIIVDQAQTLLFMLALAATLLGLFAASFEIIKEEPIYRRERMINLKIPPYLAAKFVILAGFMVIQCLLLLLVLALKVDFPGRGAILWAPLEYYLTLVLTALASVALGLFISALARSRDMVIYLVLLALFLQIVFSGAIFELEFLAKPLSYLTITRWSLEALGASTDMATLNNLGQVRVEREVDIGRGIQKVVEDVPTTITFYVTYSYSALALLSRWVVLAVQTLFWLGLAAWFMKRKDEV
jgi:ABC-type transport system involved in multi-copper enzyme maturation permease subunit